MINEGPTIHIVGGSDSWVAELVDVAQTLGMRVFIVRVRPLDEALWVKLGCQVVDLELLTPEDTVFTGSDIKPELKGAIYSRWSLEPYRELIQLQESLGLTEWTNLFHPSAWISPSVTLGTDSYIGANSSIGANTSIADHVRINRNVAIGHDVVIGQGTEIAPNATLLSGVTIEDRAFIGAGAIILNRLKIGSGATVGAGSLVTKDVDEGKVVLGSPARNR